MNSISSPLIQIAFVVLTAVALLILDPFNEADAVISERDMWSPSCERAAEELRAQARGEHSSDFASAALNQRTLSDCADRGLLPPRGTVM